MSNTAALIGTWKMVSCKREIIATGEKVDDFGPDPVGYINYGADGRFYALIVSRDRPRPASLPPTDREKLALFDTMLAYVGTYTVDDEKAVHHVDASSNEAWTGTDQVRFYRLEGDRLTITVAPRKDSRTGEESKYRIEFQKVSNSN